MPHRKADKSLVLALDIGTSSSRASLFTDDGVRLVSTTTQQAYALKYTSGGGAELSPHTLLKAVKNCIARTFANSAQRPETAPSAHCRSGHILFLAQHDRGGG